MKLGAMPRATPLLAADPARIGRYRLIGRVGVQPGAGTRGERAAGSADSREGPAPFVIYVGRVADYADSQPVTVTLLQPLPAGDTAARDRFTAEASAAREVAPFCVARVLDAGFHGEFPYLVCEHVVGPSLADVVAAEGPLDDGVLGAVAIGAATGLAAIHQAGLVHGHFGPHQIVLGPDGPRVVHSGVTPPYGRATPAADVLAWAHTMLFAATGKVRRDLGSAGPEQDARLLKSPLRELVTESLARDPAARPPAKVIVTRLLGHVQPPAGVLAEGTRTAIPAPYRGVPPRRFPGDAPPAPPVGQPRAPDVPMARSPRTAARLPGDRDRQAAPTRAGLARLAGGRASVTAAIAAAAATAAVAIAAVVLAGHHHTSRETPQAGPAASAQASSPQDSLPPPSSPPPSQPSGEPIPGALSGTWMGQLQQANPPLKIDALIHLSAGAPAGTVAYPSFGCSGVLVLTKQTHTRFVFRQGIVSGQKTCGQGTVVLTPHGTALSYAFTAATPGGPGIQGTLSRA
jgi:eukaryotic-like serine/threonine-protein kinase